MNNSESCDIQPETISAFIDGELPEEQVRDVKRHLKTCSTCNQRMNELKSVRETVQLMDPPTPSSSFADEVRDRIDQENNPGSSFTRIPSGGSVTTDGTSQSRQSDPSDPQTSSRLDLFIVSSAAAILIGIGGLFFALNQSSYQGTHQQTASSSKFSSQNRSQLQKKAKSKPSADDTSGSSSTEMNKQTAPSTAERSFSRTGARDRNAESQSASKNKKEIRKKMTTADPARTVSIRVCGNRSTVWSDVEYAFSVIQPQKNNWKLSGEIPSEIEGTKDSSEPKSRSVESKRSNSPSSSFDAKTAGRSAETLHLALTPSESKLLLAALVQRGQRPTLTSMNGQKEQAWQPNSKKGTENIKERSSESDNVKTGDNVREKRKAKEYTDRRGREDADPEQLKNFNKQLQSSQQQMAGFHQTSKGCIRTKKISPQRLQSFLNRYQDNSTSKKSDESEKKEATEELTSPDSDRALLREWSSFVNRNRPSTWSPPSSSESGGAFGTASSKKEETRSEKDSAAPKGSGSTEKETINLILHVTLTEPERKSDHSK